MSEQEQKARNKLKFKHLVYATILQIPVRLKNTTSRAIIVEIYPPDNIKNLDFEKFLESSVDYGLQYGIFSVSGKWGSYPVSYIQNIAELTKAVEERMEN